MLIEAKDLGFRFNNRPFLWRGIDIGVGPGEVLAVLGPNGTGKTTFIKVLAGLIIPTEGLVRRSGGVGYVPQATQLAFPYSVRDVVAMGRASQVGLFGHLRSDDWRVTDAIIEEVGIADLAEREFTQLSGGERQLVLIARALASQSNTILLDEPMSSLDLRNQGRILDLFERLAYEKNAAIVFSTHRPEHAFRVASTALLLGLGQVPTIGSVLDCMTELALSRLYGVEMRIIEIATAERLTRHAVAIL